MLLWRLGVSFPFGVVAPLALASCFMASSGSRDGETEATGRNDRRDGGMLLLLFAGSYALSVLAFFPTDRYRLPLVPIAALGAGRLVADIGTALKSPRVLAALAFGLVLFNLDALRPSEAYPEEEALNRAYALRMKGRTEEARDAYLEAMALNPRRIDPYNSLATMAAEQGRWEETVQRYLALLEIAPDFADVRRSLGEAYLALGRKEEARREWEIAVQLAPGLGLALADLCMSYYDDGRLGSRSRTASAPWRRDPTFPRRISRRGSWHRPDSGGTAPVPS